MFEILYPFMDFAIANAERLNTLNEGKHRQILRLEQKYTN